MRHVAERLRAQQRWSFFGQAGLAAVLLLAAGGGLWFAVAQFTADPFAPTRPHGMTCGEVLDQLPDYLAGRIDDKPTITAIENHLSCCIGCDHRYRELGGDKTFVAAPADPAPHCEEPCCTPDAP
jgi:hypothetical protein